MLPLYPHFSVSTTGSSTKELVRVVVEARRRTRRCGGTTSRAGTTIRSTSTPSRGAIESELATVPRSRRVHLLFTAHSIPLSYVERGDPYRAPDAADGASSSLERLGLPLEHSLAYQSKVGPVKWLAPSTESADPRCSASAAVSQVLAIPISFVSDHIETLYEIDILYRDLAAEAGIEHFRRTEALGLDPGFIDGARPTRRSSDSIAVCGGTHDVDVVVIGAGISGLVAAYRAQQARADASSSLGGERTSRRASFGPHRDDGFLVECGPNSVRMTDELEALIGERRSDGRAGLRATRARRDTSIVDGRLVKAPMGPASLVTTPVLSIRAKLRGCSASRSSASPRDAGEPSIDEFITRRFGREVHDMLVSAFISGIYAGDTTRLSAEAVFPALRRDGARARQPRLRGAIAAIRDRRATPTATSPKRRRSRSVAASRSCRFATGLTRLPTRSRRSLGESFGCTHPSRRSSERATVFASVPAGEATRLRATSSSRPRRRPRQVAPKTPSRARACRAGLSPSRVPAPRLGDARVRD